MVGWFVTDKTGLVVSAPASGISFNCHECNAQVSDFVSKG